MNNAGLSPLIEAGRIINTHGIAGEVKIEVWLDSPRFFRSFRRLVIEGGDVKVLSTREYKGFVIAKLEGVDDINAAMRLKEKTVSVYRRDAALPRGAFFIQDIIGFTVIDEGGAVIGKLEEVFDSPANRVYVVRGESEHMIPAVPEFIKSTDFEASVITVRLIPGM